MITGYERQEKSVIFISKGLSTNLSYNASQSINALFQNSYAISKNNIDSKNNSYRKLTQKSLEFDKL